jgi:heme-degrading monooxygenase HmoA
VIVQLSMFRSDLTEEEVRRIMEERAPRYRSVPGLLQKIYLKEGDSAEYGAILVWRDEESMRQFSGSELARTIPQAYQVVGRLRREAAEVIYVLRDEGDSLVAGRE